GAQWQEGIFENEYVKQAGIWKIRSLHFYPRIITDYEKGWAADAKPAPGSSKGFPPDRPPTELFQIYPKVYYPQFHYPNPVTGHPVQYPAGVKISRTPAAASHDPLPANSALSVAQVEAKLAEAERQLDRSIAYDAAENLINADGYYVDD